MLCCAVLPCWMVAQLAHAAVMQMLQRGSFAAHWLLCAGGLLTIQVEDGAGHVAESAHWGLRDALRRIGAGAGEAAAAA